MKTVEFVPNKNSLRMKFLVNGSEQWLDIKVEEFKQPMEDAKQYEFFLKSRKDKSVEDYIYSQGTPNGECQNTKNKRHDIAIGKAFKGRA